MYSTSSMLRTMELILGLQPMSQFDAAATPMYQAFQKTPDLAATSTSCRTSISRRRTRRRRGERSCRRSSTLAKEDQADDLLFNEVIWRSVKGADSPMPAPVRAAFVMPSAKKDDD